MLPPDLIKAQHDVVTVVQAISETLAEFNRRMNRLIAAMAKVERVETRQAAKAEAAAQAEARAAPERRKWSQARVDKVLEMDGAPADEIVAALNDLPGPRVTSNDLYYWRCRHRKAGRAAAAMDEGAGDADAVVPPAPAVVLAPNDGAMPLSGLAARQPAPTGVARNGPRPAGQSVLGAAPAIDATEADIRAWATAHGVQYRGAGSLGRVNAVRQHLGHPPYRLAP